MGQELPIRTGTYSQNSPNSHNMENPGSSRRVNPSKEDRNSQSSIKQKFSGYAELRCAVWSRQETALFFIWLLVSSKTVAQQKNKFEIVQWKRPKTWNVVGNKSFNHLSNSQVCAVHRFWVICKGFSRDFIEFCLLTPCGPPIWRPVINENICSSLCDKSAYFLLMR